MRDTDGKESLAALFDLVKTLRSEGGCPWDRRQNHVTLKKYLLEEAAEVADCLDSGDTAALCDELGDLLFQIVFHCSIAEDCGEFTFSDIARAIIAKMTRRHPHVFAGEKFDSEEALSRRWKDIKDGERASVAADSSALGSVPRNLPALMRAEAIQKAASRVGFDWPDLKGVMDKAREELCELGEAVAEGQGPERLREELGDLLFSAVNVARFMGIDAQEAMAGANA